MKKAEKSAFCGAWPRIWETAGANALLLAIALGLFLALGLRSGAAAQASSAPRPLGGMHADSEVYKGKKGGKAALLIAVSWNASSLPALLDELGSRGAQATFALSPSFVREEPEMLRRIAAEGHEAALAADGTGAVWGENGGAAGAERGSVRAALEEAARTVRSVCGQAPRLLFTGGDDALCRAAKALSLTAVRGSVDLICERGSAEEIASRAVGNISGGDIAVCAPTAAFAGAIGDILDYFSVSGLTAATVSGTIYD